MSYNVNIPVISDPILQSYQQLRANFQAINAAFSVNHASLTSDPTISGRHNVMTLRAQLSDPATSATQVALYNKLVSSLPVVFYRPNSNQSPIQLTYPTIKVDSSNTQYSFMAGPFLIYGGLVSNPSVGQTVTLTPSKTLIYVDTIVANPKGSSPITAAATGVSGNSFNITYKTSGTNQFDVYYFAVGV